MFLFYQIQVDIFSLLWTFLQWTGNVHRDESKMSVFGNHWKHLDFIIKAQKEKFKNELKRTQFADFSDVKISTDSSWR